MAGSMSDTWEAKVLNHILRSAALGLDATNVWVALGTAAADGSFTELPNSGGYARVAVNRTGTGWAAATGTSPALSDNAVAITFPAASANWNSGNNITHFAVCESGTVGGGGVIWWADLPTPKPVLTGDIPSFAIGALDVTQD